MTTRHQANRTLANVTIGLVIGILSVLFVVGVGAIDIGALDRPGEFQAVAAIVQAIATVVLVGVTGYYAYTVRGQFTRMLRDERRAQALRGLREAVIPTAEMVTEWSYEQVTDVIDPDEFDTWDDVDLDWRHLDRIVGPGGTPIDTHQRVEFHTNPQLESVIELLDAHNETVSGIREAVVDSYGRLYREWGANLVVEDPTASEPTYGWGQQWAADKERALEFVHGDDPVLETWIWDTVLEYYLDDPDLKDVDLRYARFLTDVLKARHDENPSPVHRNAEQLWSQLVDAAAAEGQTWYQEVDDELDEIVSGIRRLDRTTTRLEDHLLETLRALAREYNIRPEEVDDPDQFRDLLDETISH